MAYTVKGPGLLRGLMGGVATLLLSGALLTAAAGPVAASGTMPPPPTVSAQQESFVVGFYATGGKIVDLHTLSGEPFEQVVGRNTGARWEFGNDGAFRFVPADGGPTLMGHWEVRRVQETLELEAGHAEVTQGGRFEIGMRARIDLNSGTARVEQARRLIQNGETLASYADFSIALQ